MSQYKSYTDLPQSKKLAEFLPIESADMFWLVLGNTPRVHVLTEPLSNYSQWESYPCWSLAALFSVVRKTIGYEVLCLDRKNIIIKCELGDEPWSIEINKDNEVDACYEMILKLHEQKLL